MRAPRRCAPGRRRPTHTALACKAGREWRLRRSRPATNPAARWKILTIRRSAPHFLQSGHTLRRSECPLWARSGHRGMLRRMERATTNRGCAEDLDPCWNCRRYMLRVIKSGTPVSTAGLVQRHPDLADRTIELVEQIRSGRVAIIHTFSNDDSICLQDSGCFRGSHTGPSNECDPPFIIRDLTDSLLQVHDCRCDFAVCSVGGALGLLQNVPAGVGRSRTCCNVEGQDRPQRKHHLPDLNTHRDQPRHYRQPAPFLFWPQRRTWRGMSQSIS